MGLTQDIVGRTITHQTGMITDTSTPTATVDITHRTALHISIGSSGETAVDIAVALGTHTEEVVDTTSRTGSIDILTHRTTKQGDIGVTIHITTHGNRGVTITATVCIRAHRGTFVDQHIGIVFIGLVTTIVHTSYPDKMGIVEVHVGIMDITRIFTLTIVVITKGPGILPSGSPVVIPTISPVGIIFGYLRRRAVHIKTHIGLHTLGIEHMTHLTTTIDFPDIGTVFEIHLSILRPGINTATGAIDST